MKTGVTRMFLVVGAAALLASATACNKHGRFKPGGDGVSRDQFTFESTSWMPQTVTVRDTRTGDAIWSLDVPVGQQLVVRFVRDKGPDDFYPDAMQWDMMKLGTRHATLTNSIGVPPSSARLLEPTLRPAPEMPGALLTDGDVPPPDQPARMESQN